MLHRLQLNNFKSIRSAQIDLASMNVLIGANGSGKSNLVSFFRMLHALAHGDLQDYVSRNGGKIGILTSPCRDGESALSAVLDFENIGVQLTYSFTLAPVLNALVFTEEKIVGGLEKTDGIRFGSGHQESLLAAHTNSAEITGVAANFLQNCEFYQFNDTTTTAAIRQGSHVEDSQQLKSNGANLASYLNYLKQNAPDFYQRIAETIRQVFPHFDDFVLEPRENGVVNLCAREFGCDSIFDTWQLSDGTLRFIALTTLLLQPANLMPRLILIDEPELGLHPFAIHILASLIEDAASRTQIILATQSVEMVDAFDPESILVAERPDRETVFRRLDPAQYVEWLQEYSLGELWKKNVIGGRPSR